MTIHTERTVLLALLRGDLAPADSEETIAHLTECDRCHACYLALRSLRDDFDPAMEELSRRLAGMEESRTSSDAMASAPLARLKGTLARGVREIRVEIEMAFERSGWHLRGLPEIAGMAARERSGLVVRQIELEGVPVGRLLVEPRRASVSVLWTTEPALEGVLVTDASGEQRCARFERVEGASYLLAEVEGLPEGRFILDLLPQIPV